MRARPPIRFHASSRKLVAAFALLVTGCGLDGEAPGNGGDAGGADGGGSCFGVITYQPDQPIAGPQSIVRATVQLVGGAGVYAYSWTVERAGTPIAVAPAQRVSKALLLSRSFVAASTPTVVALIEISAVALIAQFV